MRKQLLLTGILMIAFALSACTRPYAAPEALAITPSPADVFADQKSATMDALRTERASQNLAPSTVNPTAAAETLVATLNSTAITPVTQITFTSTPQIGDQSTLLPTTPAVVCTPVACAPGQVLVCPSGDCPGGCGMACTVPTATFTPVPVGARPATYALQKYEHPYCIARRFNVNPDDVLALSGLSREQAYSLPTGTILTIPQSGSFPGDRALKPHPSGATYTVTGNDDTTLYGVACMFGDVDPGTLATLNNLPLSATLSIGQVIKIQP